MFPNPFFPLGKHLPRSANSLRYRQGIALNEEFSALVRASPDFELVTPPILGLSVLRLTLPLALRPAEADAAAVELATNDLNRALHKRLSPDRLFLTQTVLNGTVCVRFAVGAQRTEREHVERAWGLIRGCAAEVVQETTGDGGVEKA